MGDFPNTQPVALGALERVVVSGDLAVLTEAQRVEYYRAVCESLRLNPFTKPFEYIRLNGKLTLYATRTAADQLRSLHGISITDLRIDHDEDTVTVTVRGRTADGREDSEIGAVSVAGLKGEALANALMKAVTKAKRRLTLSLAGLGWLDETEIETIPTAQREASAQPKLSDSLKTKLAMLAELGTSANQAVKAGTFAGEALDKLKAALDHARWVYANRDETTEEQVDACIEALREAMAQEVAV